MFTKVQAIVPLFLPERKKEVNAQITVDADEETIEIKLWNGAASRELIDVIRRSAINIRIEVDE